MKRSLHSLAWLTLSLLSLDFARAQAPDAAPTAAPPTLSIISVKRNNDQNARPIHNPITADGIDFHGYTALQLLISGFGLTEYRRVIGAPAWMEKEQYDVSARLDEGDVAAFAKLPLAERYRTLEQVFASRFNLKYHYESRDFNVFELVAAKGGPKLISSTAQALVSAKVIGHQQYKAEGMSMSELCLMVLSTEAQVLVVDKTGLTGRYDFTLQWSRPDELINGAPSDQPLIFTAVQDQLGLKMIPAIVSTKVLVIDHIERPSEN